MTDEGEGHLLSGITPPLVCMESNTSSIETQWKKDSCNASSPIYLKHWNPEQSVKSQCNLIITWTGRQRAMRLLVIDEKHQELFRTWYRQWALGIRSSRTWITLHQILTSCWLVDVIAIISTAKILGQVIL